MTETKTMQNRDPLERTESTIEANYAHLLALLAQIEEAATDDNPEANIARIQQAANWAWNNGCGVFSSPRLEAACKTISAQLVPEVRHQPEIAIQGKAGLILSSIHNAGGHSRLAERWIAQDTKRDYVLILTRQGQFTVPENILRLEEEGLIQIVRLDQIAASLCDQALTLRHLISQLSHVSLLTHPDDPLPSIASAACQTTPPTVIIDHASHTFWLGAEIAHIAVPLLNSNARICHGRRGIPDERLCQIPLPLKAPDIQAATAQNAATRAELGIPADATVLLSSGWPYKFRQMAGAEALYDLVLPVMRAKPDLHLIVAGPTEAEPCWEGLRSQCSGQIHLLGTVDEQRLNALFAASDIYLDSAPFPSGLAMLDAVMAGLPVLKYASHKMRDCGISLDCDDIPADAYIFSETETYQQALRDLAEDKSKRRALAAMMQNCLLSTHDTEAFLAAIDRALEKAASFHERIRLDPEASAFRITDLDRYLMLLASNHDHIPATKDPDTAYPVFPVRALAFHLPQFHAIPENDAWWGSGFTEWDNVRQGAPLFDGHYQPHVPGELGYYDLSNASVLSRQADLARRFGLAGFCFYYYWFDGQRLLEKPVDQLLQHPEIDLPFCLNWANENWTRRWDGGESQVLMKQGYSPELDFKFAEDLARYFRDPRYIRVNGKPLLLIYRTDIIPQIAERTRAWREAWRKLGIGEVYLVRVESFRVEEPNNIGFDAACEFFPHQVDFSAIPPFPYPQQLTDRSARIGSYEKLAAQQCARPAPGYKRFRGVVPAWDNSARRRKGGATLFTGSSPEAYERWLTHAVRQTRIHFEGEEQLLFINAWNEWGEGCHLEPDQRYGRAYLEATQRALNAPFDVDLHYERKLKPYLDWVASTEESPAPALPEHALDCVTFVIDATAGSTGLADTLASLDACCAAGARRVLVAAQAPGTAQAEFIQADSVNAAVLGRIATVASPWLCILSPGDKLNPASLHTLAAALQDNPAPGLIYTDHDLLDAQQRRHSPNLKPDPDPDLLQAADYIGRAMLIHAAWLAKPCVSADMPWPETLYACSLAAAHDSTARWQHLPAIAFHLADSRPPGLAAERRAALLAAHFARHGIRADIQPGLAPESLRIHYQHTERPLVSIIIPTRNQLGLLRRCIESLSEKTSYSHYEVLIVDNNSDDPDTLAYLQQLIDLGLDQLQIFSYPHPFNFAAMNNLAASEARGEYLVLLNNDTAIIKGDWLEALLNHAQRPEVGAVVAKLLYPDGTIQHAGVILGLRGPAEHPFVGSPMQAAGYNQRLLLDQRYSAVTAACMMVRKSVYFEVGGMDTEAFAVSYNDIDLCLKIGSAGHAIVWTPHALVMHVGSVSQKAEAEAEDAAIDAKRERFNNEKAAMYERWLPRLAHDPAYNPGLSLVGRGFDLEGNPLFRDHPDRLKLYALCADQYGSGFYRIIAPCEQLVSTGLASGASSRVYLPPPCVAKAAPDVMIFQRQITDGQIASMQQYRKLIPAKMIFELDDYVQNLPVASAHRKDMPQDVVRNLRRAMALCDRVVVSTEPLKAAIHNFHPEIIVLPNYLPPSHWGTLPPRPPHNPARKPRVGWAGGAGHAGDLRLIRDVVQALQGKVEWVFFGMIPEGIHPDSVECHVGVSLRDYPASLATLDLDLALAPLEDNRFNACKSNLRLLEYGICGYPVIASDCEPFRCGLPVTLVRNRFKEWVAAIEDKLADRDALRREGEALQSAVRQGWMLEGDNLLRWQDGWLLSAR